MIRRVLVTVAVVAVVVLTTAPVASADPAGPTDYETYVVEIAPAVTGFAVRVIGGDAFIQLVAEPDVKVEVVGYGGEPYLVFENGLVMENDLAPTKYVNEDRYAIAEVPEEASVSASPVWVEVSSDGTYSWHDHRAHWMNPQPPPGADRGEQILEGVIPLVVDGVEVDVTVASVFQPAPSIWPGVVGLAMGLGLGYLAWVRGDGRTAALVTIGLALAATAVSLVAFFAVPAETAPSIVQWLVPLTSVGLGLWAVRSSRLAATLVGLASLELLIWSIVRRDWITAAILPTTLPFWIDRTVTGAVMAGALVVTFATARSRLAGQGASSLTSTSIS